MKGNALAQVSLNELNLWNNLKSTSRTRGRVGGNKESICFSGSQICFSSCIITLTPPVPKQTVTGESHPPAFGSPVLIFARLEHMCGIWGVILRLGGARCGDGVFTAVWGCVHSKPHTQTSHTHTLAYTPNFLKFPVYTKRRADDKALVVDRKVRWLRRTAGGWL